MENGEARSDEQNRESDLIRQRTKGGLLRDVILAYETIGVVFGGLVTSPLYVYPSMNLDSPTEEDYLGIYSIMFWTLTIIGVVKYVCIALNADDHGEGGTFALYSLLCKHIKIGTLPSRGISRSDAEHSDHSVGLEKNSKVGRFIEQSITARRIVLFISILGMCMLIGDGILTPAISVLSAMDGLRGPFPSVGKSAVEGLSITVLLALFLLQKHGTSRVSFLFSPIMGAWTLTTPIIGLYSLLRHYRSIFKALSPHYVIHFFMRNKRKGWELLGGTVLCITGAEAMFADLGHFNKKSIQMAFLFTIYPSLVITYAGQTAYLIKHPNDHSDGFYKFVPHPVYWPMFVIATLAAIVASQSLISATFSVIKQSVFLDYFPRVKVVHTSKHKEGEVYSPETNYILMVLCILVILGFGDGKAIGNAFGVVVILVMLITTILLTLVMVTIWEAPFILAMLYFVPFSILEGLYVSAVFTKIPEGGWFPFAISMVLAFVMFVWYYGRQRKMEYELTNKISMASLSTILTSSEIQRVPGLCFFYSKLDDGFSPVVGHYVSITRSLHKNHNHLEDVILAYETLGVVFGGLATSPLYVYPSMKLVSPTEDDYLGIYGIMFWTLTLIGVVKYVCIALNSDDNGEGGTFALYSLLCRNINIGILPSRSLSRTNNEHCDHAMSIAMRSKLGKYLEQSIIAQRIVLLISMLGMCMLIGDGILTPAISVLSAIDGLRGPFPAVRKSAVEAISITVLLALFLLQKHGASRVSFLFSPIMGAWTLVTPIIGVYSLLRYYPGIFKAISPQYIVHFFLRNRRKGWELLGGTVLCITGAEAMFADLGHFNKRSIQMAFLFTIYPSLVLTYAGQTSYLIRHPNDHGDGFYKFVPHTVYWPLFIIATLAAIVASQSLISATFSVIKQTVFLDYFPRVKVVHTSQHKEGEVYSPETNYILMVLCISVILGFGDGKDIGNAFGVVVILVMLITTILLTLVMIIVWRVPYILALLYFVPFVILEGVYVSAVLIKILEGGWFPFAISVVLAFIMFAWYHGRQKKIEYELANKMSMDSLSNLMSSLEVQRVPGLCFFYSKIDDGFATIVGNYIRNMRSLHKVTVFTTLRYRLVAKVNTNERIIIRKLGIDGLYGCVIQYGYADSFYEERDDFVSQVLNRLQEYVRWNSDGESPNSVEEEISQLTNAEVVGLVHVHGKARFHIGSLTNLTDKVLLGFYEFLHGNCRSALPSIGIPLQQRMEIGMFYGT